MQLSRKNGDNTHGDAISQRLAMVDAIRNTPRTFDFEIKPPGAREGVVPGAVFRSAHNVRSVRVDPGTMSWHEMQSPLPEESAAYLAAILGDDVVTADHGGGGCYSTIICDSLQVAGATATEHGREPGWNTYVRVPSVDLICHIALAKGGSVRVQPSGILGLDRRAVIADPTGAAVTIIAGGDDRRTVGAGAIGWDELRSIDPLESMRFWCSVFKWTASPILGSRDSEGLLFLNGGVAVASVHRTAPNERSSRWLPVATVRRDLLDGAVHKAIRAGARIVVAPQPHGVLGRLAVLTDPAGVEIALGAEPAAQIAAA